MAAEKNPRKTYIDVLRILAILLVLYNHTNMRGYCRYALVDQPVFKFLYILMAEFCAIGVPLFFMISGDLLLGKEENLPELFKKRILRILLVLILFTGIQYVLNQILLSGEAPSFSSFFDLLLTGAAPSYWFLYAYLAFLFMLPFLRAMVKFLKPQHYLYLLILALVVNGILPLLNVVITTFSCSEYFSFPILENTLFYPLMGYFLGHEEELHFSHNTEPVEVKKTPRTTSHSSRKLAWLLLFLSLMFQTIGTYARALPLSEYSTYDKGLFTSSFTAGMAVSVFYLVRNHFSIAAQNPGSFFVSKILPTLAGLSFGIYLTERNFRQGTKEFCDMIADSTTPVLGCILWILLVYILAGAFTFLLKKLPGFRKLL